MDALPESEKFDATTLSFGGYSVVNALVLIVAVVYWCCTSFDRYIFLIGLGGSIANILGLTSRQIAYGIGPAGPVSAISTLSTLFLTIIEAIKL